MPDDEDPVAKVPAAAARGRVDARSPSATTSATLEQWPEPPEWELGAPAGATGRSSPPRSTSRCARPAARCTRCSSASRGRCASSTRSASATRRRPTRSTAGSAAIPTSASSSTPPRPGRSRCAEDLAATGAVDVVDFKGQYGMEVEDAEALAAMYEHVVATFPDAILEDPHDLPEIRRGDRAARRPRLLRRADPPGRRPRHDAGQPDPRRQHQAVPHRQPARAARALRRCEADGLLDVRRRDGRARRRARPDPAARVDLPPRRAERRRAERASTGPTPPEGLPTSPLPPAPEATGFRRELSPR